MDLLNIPDVTKDKHMINEEKLNAISDIIWKWGGIDGGHHKQWVLDQIVRIVCGTQSEYDAWIKRYNGPDNKYKWDEGIAP